MHGYLELLVVSPGSGNVGDGTEMSSGAAPEISKDSAGLRRSRGVIENESFCVFVLAWFTPASAERTQNFAESFPDAETTSTSVVSSIWTGPASNATLLVEPSTHALSISARNEEITSAN